MPANVRGLLWKIFSWCEPCRMPQDTWTLSRRGEHPSETRTGKIKKDAPRTLATDELYLKRVSQDALVRVLNAFLHAHADSSSMPFLYVQGMNVLLAPLLCVMPEPDAYFAI